MTATSLTQADRALIAELVRHAMAALRIHQDVAVLRIRETGLIPPGSTEQPRPSRRRFDHAAAVLDRLHVLQRSVLDELAAQDLILVPRADLDARDRRERQLEVFRAQVETLVRQPERADA